MPSVGAAGGVRLKNIQEISATWTSGTSDSTTITEVDLSKTILIWHFRGAAAAPTTSCVVGELFNSTTVRFSTNGATSVNIDATAFVVEFEGDIDVQHFSVKSTLGDKTVACNSVDLLRTFILPLGFRKDGSTAGSDDMNELYFNSNIEVQAKGKATSANQDVDFQVVQCAGCKVQEAQSDISAWSSATHTESTGGFDPSRSLLFASTQADPSSIELFDDQMATLSASADGTSYTLERANSASMDYETTVYIAQFDDAVSVQRGNVTRGFNHADATISIRPVDQSATSTRTPSAINNWGTSELARTSDEYNVFCNESYLLDGSQLYIDWDSPVSQTGSIAWEVATWRRVEEVAPFILGGVIAAQSEVTDVPVSAALDGTGEVALASQVDVPALPVLDGTGEVALSTQVDVPVTLVFDGTGEVALATQVDLSVTQVIDGAGEVALTAQVDVPVSAVLEGTGEVSLTVSVSGDVSASPVLDGVGSVALTYTVDVPATLAITGTGEVALTSVVDVPVSPVVSGAGTVALSTSVGAVASPVITGTGEVALAYSVTGFSVTKTIQRAGRYAVSNVNIQAEKALRQQSSRWLRTR